jgi:hypothetical protein
MAKFGPRATRGNFINITELNIKLGLEKGNWDIAPGNDAFQ